MIAFNYELILWDLVKGSKTKLLEAKNINVVRFNTEGSRIVFGLFEGEVYKVDITVSDSDSSVSESESASE